ncbi:hypothetical protein HDU83_009568 [Entophlyctis luteolus]|nr:hypothetical protein HDU83_009568 [Entophlyctis luteolus]
MELESHQQKGPRFYHSLRKDILEAANRMAETFVAISGSTDDGVHEKLKRGCFLFLPSPLFDQEPVSFFSEKLSVFNLFGAVAETNGQPKVRLTGPDVEFIFHIFDANRENGLLSVPVLLNDSFIDIVQYVGKQIVQSLKIKSKAFDIPSTAKSLKASHILKKIPAHGFQVEFRVELDPGYEKAHLSCPALDEHSNKPEKTQPKNDSFAEIQQILSRRLNSTEEEATTMVMSKNVEHVSKISEFINNTLEKWNSFKEDEEDAAEKILERLNQITQGLQFMASVGEYVPFLGAACKVISACCSYFHDLEEAEASITELKENAQLLKSVIDMKVKVYFSEDSHWIIDDVDCLKTYQAYCHSSILALRDVTEVISRHRKQGKLKKLLHPNQVDIKKQIQTIDFALKQLTLLDPSQLAFDISRYIHLFSEDGLRFWRSSLFRETVPIDRFLERLEIHTQEKFTDNDEKTAAIIESVDTNRDGFIQIAEFIEIFNLDDGRETVSRLLTKAHSDLQETVQFSKRLNRIKTLLNPTDYSTDIIGFLNEYVPETRDKLVNEIHQKVSEGTKSTIFVLKATAGFGKSSIAAKLTTRSSKEGAVYFFYFFKIDDVENRTIDDFLKTLVYQLCCYRSNEIGPSEEKHLSATIEEFLLINGSRSMERFRKLLSEIVYAGLSAIPNAVLLIDAADECPRETMKSLIQFIEGLGRFTSSVAVVITVRNDSKSLDTEESSESSASQNESNYDALRYLSENFEKSSIYDWQPSDLESMAYKTENENALRIFFESNIRRLDMRGCDLLIEKSHQKMLWAKIAVNLIGDAQNRMDADVTYIAHRVLKTGLAPLYLESFKAGLVANLKEREELKGILSIIYVAETPLHKSIVEKAWLSKRQNTPELSRLFSRLIFNLLSRLMIRKDTKENLTLGHKSLRDLIEKNRLRRFVDERNGHGRLASLCFEILGKTGAQTNSSTTTEETAYAYEYWLYHAAKAASEFAFSASQIEGLPLLKIAHSVYARKENELQTEGTESWNAGEICWAPVGEEYIPGVVVSKDTSPYVTVKLVTEADATFKAKDLKRKDKKEQIVSFSFGGSNIGKSVMQFRNTSRKTQEALNTITSVRDISTDSNAECAIACLDRLSGLRKNFANLRDPYVSLKDSDLPIIPFDIAYASCYWGLHFTLSSQPSTVIVSLRRFCVENLLPWIEVMLLLFWKSTARLFIVKRCLSIAVDSVKKLDVLDKNVSLIAEILSDSVKILSQMSESLAHNPLQLYYSALVWFPQNSQLYKTYHSKYPDIPIISILRGCQWLSDRQNFHLLDSSEGALSSTAIPSEVDVSTAISSKRVEPSESKPVEIVSIAMSSELIVGIYKITDRQSRVKVWRRDVEMILPNFRDKVVDAKLNCVAISNDDQWILCGSDTCLWRIYIKDGTSEHFARCPCKAVVISRPRSSEIVPFIAVAHECQVLLWSVDKKFSKLLVYHRKSVTSLSLSNELSLFLSGSEDGIVNIWSSTNWTHLKIIQLKDASLLNSISCVVVGEMLRFAAGEKSALRLYDYDFKKNKVARVYCNAIEKFGAKQLLFSSTGKLLYVCDGHYLRVLNTEQLEQAAESQRVMYEQPDGGDCTCFAISEAISETTLAIASRMGIKISELSELLQIQTQKARVQPNAVDYPRIDSGVADVANQKMDATTIYSVFETKRGFVVLATAPGMLEVRNISNAFTAPKKIFDSRISADRISAISFGGDFAVCTGSGYLLLVSLLDFQIKESRDVVLYEYDGIRLSPDGSVVFAVDENAVYVWKWRNSGKIEKRPGFGVQGLRALDISNTTAIWAYDVGTFWLSFDQLEPKVIEFHHNSDTSSDVNAGINDRLKIVDRIRFLDESSAIFANSTGDALFFKDDHGAFKVEKYEDQIHLTNNGWIAKRETQICWVPKAAVAKKTFVKHNFAFCESAEGTFVLHRFS